MGCNMRLFAGQIALSPSWSFRDLLGGALICQASDGFSDSQQYIQVECTSGGMYLSLCQLVTAGPGMDSAVFNLVP